MLIDTKLLVINCVGLLASFLMFSGDMLLYFTKREYKESNSLMTEIMPNIPDWRLKLGGNIGPISAFFYVVGFFQMSLVVHEQYHIYGIIVSGLLILGIIIGAAYHSHFTYLGLLGKLKDKTSFNVVADNTRILRRLYLVPFAIGFVLFSVLIIFNKTIFPVWFVFFTPTVTFFFIFLWRYLPQPFRVIVLGGWTNLIFALYFSASILLLI